MRQTQTVTVAEAIARGPWQGARCESLHLGRCEDLSRAGDKLVWAVGVGDVEAAYRIARYAGHLAFLVLARLT